MAGKPKPNQRLVWTNEDEKIAMRLEDDLLEEARKARMNYTAHNENSIVVSKGDRVQLIIYAGGQKFTLKSYDDPNREYLIIQPTPAFRKLKFSDVKGILAETSAKHGLTPSAEDIRAASANIYTWAINGNKTKGADAPGFVEDFLIAFKDYVKTERVRGFVNLYNRLTSSYDIFEALFQTMFGTAPTLDQLVSHTGSDVEKVRDAIIQFGDMPSKKRVNIRAIVNQTERVMKKYGLENLMKTRFIVKTTLPVAGTYTPVSDHVELNSGVTATKTAVYVLIHELGHRLYYRAKGLSDVAAAKYSEIAGKDVGRTKDTQETLSDMDDIMKVAHNGFVSSWDKFQMVREFKGTPENRARVRQAFLDKCNYITYSGRKLLKYGIEPGGIIIIQPLKLVYTEGGSGAWRYHAYKDVKTFLEDGPSVSHAWEAWGFFGYGDGFYLMATPRLQERLSQVEDLSVFKSRKINMNFRAIRKAHTALNKSSTKGYHDGKRIYRKDWHVTNYAQTNVDEWFAELFTYYILGQLSAGDPKQWMKSIIAGYRDKIQ